MRDEEIENVDCFTYLYLTQTHKNTFFQIQRSLRFALLIELLEDHSKRGRPQETWKRPLKGKPNHLRSPGTNRSK